MEEISDHAKNLTLSEDLEKPLEDRVNLFYSFVKVRVPPIVLSFPRQQFVKQQKHTLKMKNRCSVLGLYA